MGLRPRSIKAEKYINTSLTAASKINKFSTDEKIKIYDRMMMIDAETDIDEDEIGFFIESTPENMFFKVIYSADMDEVFVEDIINIELDDYLDLITLGRYIR